MPQSVCSFALDVQCRSSRFEDVMESKTGMWVRAASWGDGGFLETGAVFPASDFFEGPPAHN